jgi:hypothetical protein
MSEKSLPQWVLSKTLSLPRAIRLNPPRTSSTQAWIQDLEQIQPKNKINKQRSTSNREEREKNVLEHQGGRTRTQNSPFVHQMQDSIHFEEENPWILKI